MSTDPSSQSVDARLQALMNHAPLAFGLIQGERLALVSDQFNQLFACHDEHGLAGAATRSLLASQSACDGVHERMGEAMTAHQPFVEEVECARRDGGRFWARLEVVPVSWDAPAGERLWWMQDVTAERQARQAPTWTSSHDTLTELSNRREFERRIGDHVGSHRREAVSVLWLDMDRFNDVNEQLGQAAGDQLLCVMARLFVTKLRTDDLIARLDADRFGVLLPNCDQHYAQLVGEKLRGAVAGHRLRWATRSTRVHASVGVVQISPELDTVASVMEAAKSACREAKQAGGDCVRVHVASVPTAAV